MQTVLLRVVLEKKLVLLEKFDHQINTTQQCLQVNQEQLLDDKMKLWRSLIHSVPRRNIVNYFYKYASSRSLCKTSYFPMDWEANLNLQNVTGCCHLLTTPMTLSNLT